MQSALARGKHTLIHGGADEECGRYPNDSYNIAGLYCTPFLISQKSLQKLLHTHFLGLQTQLFVESHCAGVAGPYI